MWWQVIVADNVECFLPRSPCSNLAVIANKQSPWPGGLDTHEDQGFEHADGAVSFATNLYVLPICFMCLVWHQLIYPLIHQLACPLHLSAAVRSLV